VWGAETYSKGVSFNNYYSNKTACGAPQRVFGLNEYSSDHIPVQNFDRAEFNNIHDEALAFIMDPP